VIVVKLADRLHNAHWVRAPRKAVEDRRKPSCYAIVHRLGMGKLRFSSGLSSINPKPLPR
jgi:(p)ppGpp synthase/HD superfamily hydrolase